MESLQDRLKFIKAKYHLDAKALAEMMGAETRQIIYNYLDGRTAIPLDEMKALAKALALDEQWVLTGRESAPASALDPMLMHSTDFMYALVKRFRDLESRIEDLEKSQRLRPKKV